MSIASYGLILPPDQSPWGDIARLCRRICTLRARRHSAEADRLAAAELEPALEALRRTEPGESAIAARLAEVFAAENERVANAVAFADVLAPLLADRLHREIPADPSAVNPHPPAPPRRPSTATPEIADFIDEMLRHERRAS